MNEIEAIIRRLERTIREELLKSFREAALNVEFYIKRIDLPSIVASVRNVKPICPPPLVERYDDYIIVEGDVVRENDTYYAISHCGERVPLSGVYPVRVEKKENLTIVYLRQ